ncbi:MAG: NUDIX domain-containing protein [Bryobacterales bacterium]|nr:NUDIX domain-containing protein [Bryobacterales bacterium]
MNYKVEILRREEVFRKFFRIDEVTLRHQRFDGAMSPEMTRLVLNRGDSVALLLADRARDAILLCEQFRLPTYGPQSSGWIHELPAGVLEPNEDPQECARREALEETGYSVSGMHRIATVYLSPGGSSERIHIFYAEIADGDRIQSGGGLASEHEDIRMVWLPIADARRQCAEGAIADAKTLIAIQWLMLRSEAKS